MRSFLATLVILLGVAAAAVYQSAFIVHQNEQVLVLRFGELKRVVKTPGLNWKVPILDTVDYFDKRILDLDSQAQDVTASRTRCCSSKPYVTSATSALASRRWSKRRCAACLAVPRSRISYATAATS